MGRSRARAHRVPEQGPRGLRNPSLERTPIYNLAVVSDDIAMGITVVMRGDDHISNTPKQILLYRALGARLPTFAHLPMIHGMDGKKLSKRHGATAVGDYQHHGLLPGAMLNFLALLGWSPGGDREVMTMPEMIELFTRRRASEEGRDLRSEEARVDERPAPVDDSARRSWSRASRRRLLRPARRRRKSSQTRREWYLRAARSCCAFARARSTTSFVRPRPYFLERHRVRSGGRRERTGRTRWRLGELLQSTRDALVNGGRVEDGAARSCAARAGRVSRDNGRKGLSAPEGGLNWADGESGHLRSAGSDGPRAIAQAHRQSAIRASPVALTGNHENC